MEFPVGGPQRREIKHWRGLRRGSFDYNEDPTSSCQYVLLEGASVIRRAFFLIAARPFRAFTSLRDVSLHRNGCAVLAPA
jgi:hypothetical protein